MSTENNGSSSHVDYEKTAQMRMDIAVNNVQKFSSMAIFDKSYSEKAKLWFEYFSEIKGLYDAGEFESVFGVEMPE